MDFPAIKESEPSYEGPFHPLLQAWVDSPRVPEGDIEGILSDVQRLFSLLQFNLFHWAEDETPIEFKNKTIVFPTIQNHLNFSSLSGESLGLSFKVMALLYRKYPELKGRVYLFDGGDGRFFDQGQVVVFMSPDAFYDYTEKEFVHDSESVDAPRFWIIDPILKTIIADPGSSAYKVSIMKSYGFRLMFSPLMSPDEHIFPFGETTMGSVVGPVAVALSSKEEMVYLVWNPKDAAVFKCEEFEVGLDPGVGRRGEGGITLVPIEKANDFFEDHFCDDPEIVDFLNRFHVRLRALETRQRLLSAS